MLQKLIGEVVFLLGVESAKLGPKPKRPLWTDSRKRSHGGARLGHQFWASYRQGTQHVLLGGWELLGFYYQHEAFPQLGISLHQRSEVTASQSMSPICLLVLWELLEALVWFAPNVKALPRSIKLDLWVWANNCFPKSMSSVIQSAALQGTERLVRSSSLVAFHDCCFMKIMSPLVSDFIFVL